MKKVIQLSFFFVILSMFGQTRQQKSAAENWVNKTYQSLTLEQKIGQLFMVAAYSKKGNKHISALEQMIQKYHIGGVIFFQGGPHRQAKITNRLQKKSKIPLFVGLDAEWGLNMRLDSTYCYPWNMSLGAIQNNNLIDQLGVQMGEQAKRLGVHFVFAPVVDINTNPNNPIIGNRSFGEDKYNVADKSSALVKGIQSTGVFATAKHFPGHGDTSKDSHKTLPKITFDRKRIENIELYPYKQLIKNNLASVMVAHLEVPALEPKKGKPTSISYNTVTGLLKNQLGFEGLIFTDALNMKGAANFKGVGDIDLAAFKAGNDVLLFPENVALAVKKIKKAFKKGDITKERLAYSVKKILRHKFEVGLNTTPQIDLEHLSQDLNSYESDDLSFVLYRDMMTLLQNKQNILPLSANDNVAYIPLQKKGSAEFYNKLKRYGNVKMISFSEAKKHPKDLRHYDKIIIGNHKKDDVWKKNNFTKSEINWISKIAFKHSTVLVSFAKPYTLAKLKNKSNLSAVLLAYQNNSFAFEAVSNALYGYADIHGKLPVSIGKSYPVGHGIRLLSNKNISISTPSLEQVNPDELNKIDAFGERMVQQKLTPGGVVMVLKNSKIIYNKSFGNFDYKKKLAVESNTIYDLASLTKMLGTLPLIMKLYEEKKIKFEDTLGDLLFEFKNTDKSSITVKELLTHQSGLKPWIPFYKSTLDTQGKPSKNYYKLFATKNFPTQVSEHLFLKKGYKFQMLKEIRESDLREKIYKYSDLNFILLQQIVERKFHKPIDVLLNKHFIQPMGLETITYNPLEKYDESKIAPTENDYYFRHTKVQGYVHDMGAAMLGGVGGHAGIFSNAYDVASFMQFFLDEGAFLGKRILKPSTIRAFNKCYYCSTGNRRGAGFDKPNLKDAGNTCGCTSSNSFGHTGFTGTMAWADPDKNLIYIFLSNRTFPTAEKNRLSKENIREDIQQVVYNALLD